MSKIRSTLPLLLVVMFFSFAFAFEASFTFKHYMAMDFFISADSLPNTILFVINHYYIICYLIIFHYIKRNKKYLIECKSTTFKNLSDKASSFAVHYLLLIMLSLSIFYIKIGTTESYYNVLLIPSLYFIYLLYSHKLLIFAIKSSLKAKLERSSKTLGTKHNFQSITQQSVIATVFVCLFTGAVTTGLWAGLMTKNIAYIGNKSLTLSAPICPVGILKIGICKYSKNSIIESGNLVALGNYYTEYPPIDHREAYSDLSYTINYANIIYSTSSWASAQGLGNNYQYFKNNHNEYLEYNLMTLEMYKKAILEGDPDAFVKNQLTREVKSGLKFVFEQI